MLGRYCGQHSPPDIRSSGRYLWIKFVTDGELEAVGFSASYNFTAGTSATFLVDLWTWLLWEPCCCIDHLSVCTVTISVSVVGWGLIFGVASLYHRRSVAVCVFELFPWAGGGRE